MSSRRESKELLHKYAMLRKEFDDFVQETNEKVTEMNEQLQRMEETLPQSNNCWICIDRVYNIALFCGHLFCQECVDKWLEQKKDCPICRSPVETGFGKPYLKLFVC